MPRTARPTVKLPTPKGKLLDPTTLSNTYYVRYPKPTNYVIQGIHRHPKSQAAKTFVNREKDRLRKALDYLTHGKDIFAYSHIRTNQVVYSLSRFLHQSEVLSQLLYHGKKTVPAGLRRDMWVPYFSVHFRDAEPGLYVYRLLREFSTRRQLEPPKEMITNAPETVGHKRPKDLIEAEKWDKTWRRRMGQIMTKKDRARRLMDQKATSVADLAFVLQLQKKKKNSAPREPRETGGRNADGEAAQREQEEKPTSKEKHENATPEELERLKELKKVLAAKEKEQTNLTNAAKRRQRRAEKEMNSHRKKVETRIQELEWQIGERVGEPVSIRDTRCIAGHELEHEDAMVLWKDMQDSRNAREWPSSVIHRESDFPLDNHMNNEPKGENERRIAQREAEKKAREEARKKELAAWQREKAAKAKGGVKKEARLKEEEAQKLDLPHPESQSSEQNASSTQM